eukprot:1577074-Pleurochrysis_carterae.AAC.4
MAEGGDPVALLCALTGATTAQATTLLQQVHSAEAASVHRERGEWTLDDSMLRQAAKRSHVACVFDELAGTLSICKQHRLGVLCGSDLAARAVSLRAIPLHRAHLRAGIPTARCHFGGACVHPDRPIVSECQKLGPIHTRNGRRSCSLAPIVDALQYTGLCRRATTRLSDWRGH